MKDIPLSERPRERLALLGAEALSAAELLAVLLGKGTKGKPILELARELISHFGSIEALQRASVAELTRFEGLGQAKALQLRAAFEIARRSQPGACAAPSKVRSTQEAYDAFWPLFSARSGYLRELLAILIVDVRDQVIDRSIIGEGTLTKVLFQPRDIIFHVIRNQGFGFYVAHNHPSGDCTPSRADKRVTSQLLALSNRANVHFCDHVILGKGSYYSLKKSARYNAA